MYCELDEKVKNKETGEIYNIEYKQSNGRSYLIKHIESGKRTHIQSHELKKYFEKVKKTHL